MSSFGDDLVAALAAVVVAEEREAHIGRVVLGLAEGQFRVGGELADGVQGEAVHDDWISWSGCVK